MKTAICFSGVPRFIKEGHKMFSKNLIGFEEMDVLKTGINNLYLGKNVEKMKARKLKQEQEQNRKNKSKNDIDK